MKKNNDYVDNKLLLIAIAEWQQRRLTTLDLPLTDEIGRDVMLISYNLSKRWNFSGYTDDWKEQMIGDGIEAALKAVKNFDAIHFSNPHAYLTTVCFRAFQNRIKKERQESVGKYKYFVEEVYDFTNDEISANVDVDFYQDMVNKIAEYDESKKKQCKVEPDCDEELPLLGLGKIYGNEF
jgi:hypothetical protein